MRIDLHNHTPRCNHANGTPLEFANKASKLGIDIYGFACHAPMNFDTDYRMKLEELDEYIDEISSLQNRLQEQAQHHSHKQAQNMQILVGLEVDFILGREDL